MHQGDKGEYKLKQYFVYADETHEGPHYPSNESENAQDIKQQLIRQIVKEGDVELDSRLIENIFEYPHETQDHMQEVKRVNKSKAILN